MKCRRIWLGILLFLGGALSFSGCGPSSVQLLTEPEVQVARLPRLVVLPFFAYDRDVSDPTAAERLGHGLAEYLRKQGGYVVVELSAAQLGPEDAAAQYLEAAAAVRAARKADATGAVGGYVVSEGTKQDPPSGERRHVVAAVVSVFDAIEAKMVLRREESVALDAAAPGSSPAEAEAELIRRLGRSFVSTQLELRIPDKVVATAAEFADGKPIGSKAVFSGRDAVVPVVVALPPEYDRARLAVRVIKRKVLVYSATLVWDGAMPFRCVRVRPAELFMRTGAGEYRIECYIGETRIGRAYFQLMPVPGVPSREDLEIPGLTDSMKG